ncbi:MAG: hypothetical protein VR69_14785 [Peptococcaceae bacterium BRH_c4b]|nr:MAG: hypothetical protein VR69_14785 [Peptococcaceae bacterium BRH_c4b]
MCGIVGLIDNVMGHIDENHLREMNDEMVNRGPDGEGFFIEGAVGMAMRRLSIIDIEGGWQPFFSGKKNIVAFQNGEIYNYRGLREQLENHGYLFNSKSDTEVLAHGYDFWGMEGLLKRIDGMYAIAIYDRRSRELHLARDRFGEKPLFYAYARGRFAYSSNMVVLAALPWVSEDIDLKSLDRYLALHYIPGDATILKGIHRVLPGERLVISVDAPIPQRERYYNLLLGSVKKISDEQLANLVEEAVSSRLVADVPVGVFLSGGLDSSIVAAIAARKQPRIATFSMGFSKVSHDESVHAAKVAELIGSTHYHFQFDEESFRDLLPKVACALDEPIGDQALLPVFWLSREARRHVTVVLAGEGADEVFSGYSYYRTFTGQRDFISRIKALFSSSASNATPLNRLIYNRVPVSPSGFPLLTDGGQRKNLLGIDMSDEDSWEKELMIWLDSAGTSLQKATVGDIATWLPDDLLVKFDRMAMAHSLEGRAPYLYPDLVQAGVRMPDVQRMHGNVSKYALRRIARNWLPDEILKRPKQGFVLPMKKWISQWFIENGSVEKYLSEFNIPGLDTCNLTMVIKNDLAAGVQRERLLFAVLMLIEWYKAFIKKRKELLVKYKKANNTIITEGRK